MALVNPQIAMSYRPTVEYQPRNALAEYAQIQSIVGGQRQAEMADMQMEALRRERDALGQIQAAIVAKGGPPDLEAAADAMIKTGRPEYLTQGMAIRTALRNQREAEAYRREYGGGATPANALVAPAAAAPASQGEPVAAPILPSTVTARDIPPVGGAGAPAPLTQGAAPVAKKPLMQMSPEELTQYFAARRQDSDERAREIDRAEIARIRQDIDELPDVFDNKGRFSFEARSEIGRRRIEDLLARRYNREDVAPISTEPVVVAPFAPTAAPVSANALAPAAAAPVANAMVAPAAVPAAAVPVAAAAAAPDANAIRLRALEAQYRRIGNNPELASEKALVLKQIEDVQATIRAESATPPEAKFMRALGLPLTREGYAEFEALKQRPGEFERLLSQSGLPKADQTALIRQRLKKEVTHAPGTTVNVSTEKKYGEAFGTRIAEVDINKMTTAEKAPQLADSANRIIGLVQQGNLFTGPAADIKLNIARALNVAGASNQEKISNTESLIAATGQSTLDAIKGAGLGTGQGFTDKDLKFLRDIAGGTINLTQQTLTELARLQHRVAERSAESWNKRLREIPPEVVQGTGLSTTPIVVPKLLSAPRRGAAAADVPPAPAGVDAAIWNAMTPQERSLWQK